MSQEFTARILAAVGTTWPIAGTIEVLHSVMVEREGILQRELVTISTAFYGSYYYEDAEGERSAHEEVQVELGLTEQQVAMVAQEKVDQGGRVIDGHLLELEALVEEKISEDPLKWVKS